MPRTRCYRDGDLVDEGFDISQVSEHLEDPTAVVWVDLLAPGEADLALLADELGLHALAVEDALTPGQRTKLDVYPDHSFLAAYEAATVPAGGPGTTAVHGLLLREVVAFITPQALVTVHVDPELDVDGIVAHWDSQPALARNGVSFLVHGLLDHLVDGYFEAVEQLDDEVDALADSLFERSAQQPALQRRTFELRQQLAHLRRVAVPMREVVNSLMRREISLLRDEMGPYYQDLYDHALRIADWAESLRDLITGIFDANLALQGNRLNVITKKVTGWAAIVAVPTAITGFYGQNVPYPGFGQWSGFLGSTGVIVGASAALYLLFRHNDWI